MDVLLSIVVFIAVVFIIMALAGVAQKKEPGQFVTREKKPFFFELFSTQVSFFGSFISGSSSAAKVGSFLDKTRRRLISTNLISKLHEYDILGMQILAAITLGLVIGGVTFLFTRNLTHFIYLLLGGGAIGWFYPSLWLAMKADNRKDAIFKSLPYSIDLLTVSMQAGQDFGAAVRFLVREGPPGPLKEEFAMMLHETELGTSRVDALKKMAERLQIDEFNAIVTAIAQSAELGSSLAETLKLQGEELRKERFNRAERKAARASSIMIVPTAIFILPIVFVIVMVPIFIKYKMSTGGAL